MKLYLLIFSLLFVSVFAKAQVDPNLVLVLNKGTTAEINAITPEKGAMVYNTDDDQIYQFNGSSWVVASSDGDDDPSNELQALSYDPVTHIVTLTNGGTIDLSALMTDEDWTVTGNDQYSAVAGNVGIGNSSPSVKLDVTGDVHATETINIGPNATGSRLSIFDNGHTGSMLDIQTDDNSPWGFRLLNNSYSSDLANSFRMYQNNSGRFNMSVGALTNSFFTIDPEYSNGYGSVGIGSTPADNIMLNLNRGTYDVGDGTYYNLYNRITRSGNNTSPANTIGVYNYLIGNVTGDSMSYVANQNVAYIPSGAYGFRSLTGTYSFAYSRSTADNSDKVIYGTRSYGYDYSDGGTRGAYGGYFAARKQDGAADISYLYGMATTVSRVDDSAVGHVSNAYGLAVNAYGATNSVRGVNVTARARTSDVNTLYGANFRVYADSTYQAIYGYGVNINSSKYKGDITDIIYNINVSSTGHTNLTNNYGSRYYLRDGANNYGVYIDVSNGSSANYALYANYGKSYFRENVGIGTSTPDEALHVSGNMRLTGAFEDKDGQAGSVGQILASTATGTDWIDGSSLASANGWTIAGNDTYTSVSGDVGIGTSTPDQKLDVNGNAVIGTVNVDNTLDGQGHFQSNSALSNAGFVATPWVYARAIEGDQRGGAATLITLGSQNGLTNNDQIGFYTNGAQRMIINSDGRIGVNTTSPTTDFDINGALRVRSIPASSGTQWLIKDGSGNIRVYASDQRLKKDVKSIDKALDKVLALDGKHFAWRESGQKDIGFIAQEVESVFPELVSTTDDGYKALSYPQLTAVLANALKEMHAENQKLKAQLDRVDQRLDAIEKKLSK